MAQALGVSSVYVSDPSLITKLLFPKHSGHNTPGEPQLPRALSRAAPRRFLSFPQGNRDDSYHLSDTQLNNLIMKVSLWKEKTMIDQLLEITLIFLNSQVSFVALGIIHVLL